MKSLFILFTLVLSSALHAESINKDQVKPGAAITVQLPEFGKSWRTEGKEDVEAKFILPANFDAQKSYPLILALGGGAGSPGACDRWSKVMEQKHFVFMGVDYNKDGYDSGFPIAEKALEKLKGLVKIDEERMMVTGFSSGAYSISHMYNTKFGRKFSAYIPMGGGMPLEASAVRKKHVLWVCGDKDTKKASSGESRIVVVRRGHKILTKAKVDSTLIEMKGVPHRWDKAYDKQIKEWVFSKLIDPVLEESYKKAIAYEKSKKLVQAYEEFVKVTDFNYKDSVAKAKAIKEGYDVPFKKAKEAMEKEKDYYLAYITFNELLKSYGKVMAKECESLISEIKGNPAAIKDIKARAYYLKVEKAHKSGKVAKEKIKDALQKVLDAAPDTKSSSLAKALMDELGN